LQFAPRSRRSRSVYVAAAALASAASSIAPTSLHAQSPRLELDLSGTRIAYDTLAALTAPSLAALTEWQRPSLFARLSGSVTGLEDSGWSLQGRGDLAGWLAPFGSGSGTRLELGGALGGGRHSSGFDSFLARTDARLHLRRRAGGVGVGAWLGASLATARNSFDSAAVMGLVPQVGAWVQGRSVRATLGYLHSVVSGDAYPEANLALTLTRGSLDLTLYGGARASPYGTAALDERWAGATAAYWLTRNAAVVVSGGRYASDVLQNLPGGEFVSVGLRLTPRRSRPIPITATAPIVYTTEQATRGDISFAIDGASRVEIAGDWNGWIREPLSRDPAGRWVVPPGLPPGVHRFNLRVDGERWVVPDGVPAVDDGFGGRVGLLIVEM
jgi:hypothetical protein